MSCSKCSKKSKETFNCDSCKRCFCYTCSELTNDEMRCMTLRKRKLIFLYSDCEEGLRKIHVLSKEVEVLKEDLKKLREQSSTPNFTQVESFMFEMQERQTRVCNIIVTNIQESSQTTRTSRINEDTSTIKNILRPSGIEEQYVNYNCKIQRLGKYEEGKNRPVKVILPSRDHAVFILKNKNKINIPNVKIFGDQTKMQREYYFKLRKQLEDLKDDSKVIKYINNIPKIVTKTKNT